MGLDSLIGGINQLIGNADNSPKNLDGALPGDPSDVVNFGALGDYLNKIDTTAQRSYVESGYIRNIRPRQSEDLLQEPDMTVLIKKRMFSSLVENFKPELMDAKDKLFYRASKKLFQNKCAAIAAYEQLCKIDRIVANTGMINDYLFPLISDGISTLSSLGTNVVDAATQSTLDEMKKVKFLSDPSYRTTWVADPSVPAIADLGDGTGVIDFTNVASVTCSSSVIFGGGSCSLTIEDPYKLMLVTNDDIDKAIRDSAGGFLQNSFFKTTQMLLSQTVSDLRSQLSSIRLSRGATTIQFLVNEDSLLFNKVRAIIDEEGREINFNYNGGLAGIGSSVDVDAGALEGQNGLHSDNGELDIFKQVIKNIYLLIASQTSTQINSFQFNSDTNYVRRKMRLHFGSKPIIQPMDVIHIFVGTKSTLDPKTASIINTSFNPSVINGLSGSIANALNSLSSLFSPNSFDVAEKNAIVGPQFPMWLWNIMRNDFTRQAAGTQIFSGIIESSQHNYNGGKYILSTNAKDNCGYFSLGRINVSPSVEVFNSALYDPLTPFDLDVNTSTGFQNGDNFPALLPENISLLNSGLIKFKGGRFFGYTANQQIYNGFDVEKVRGSTDRYAFRRKFEDPDGLIYRWKEGIQTKTLLGESHVSANLTSDVSPNLQKSPYAGQDVMNVLSLLITGIPYNYNTFLKSAISTGSLSRDSLTNDNGSASFFRGLLGDISKQNSTWGNFIPFKKLVVNESAYKSLLSGQYDATMYNQQINSLLQDRAKKFDTLVKVIPGLANNPQILNANVSGQLPNATQLENTINTALSGNPAFDPTAISKIASDIISTDFQIQQSVQLFQNSITNPNINTTGATIKIFGDDISFDPTVNQNTGGVTSNDVQDQRNQFRNQLNLLTQRRLWKVRANEDQNLFVVDDSFDKNYDIQAFGNAIADSLELFKSNYVDIASQITMVASLLGLEVFADSQGNIQARSPQYNKMPSSVFYDMMKNKNLTGVQLFPSYLENLFIGQIQGLVDKIETDEDQIRIRVAAIGYVTDDAAKKILSGLGAGSGSTNFSFTTDESTGQFGGKDIRVMISQINPDLSANDLNTSLKSIGNSLNTIKNTLSTANSNVNFDIVQRVNLVNNTSFGGGASDADINDRINTIGNRLYFKTGQPPPTKLSLLSSNGINSGTGIPQVDVLNITNQLSQLIGDRQSVIKLLSNAIKNLGDGINLNISSQGSGVTSILPFSSVNGSNNLPDIIEHMIEYENIDDFGYNSGSRYVIRDHQIISFQLREEPPQYTSVEVTGLFGEGLVDPPGGFDTGGGNPITTAWGVDFDLWRMYGFRSSQPFNAPFLSDPDTQCAPYSVVLLNKARKEIFQAEMEIAGNEFIQPGEVYYIEDYGLLFYAEKVSHNFSYGAGYTTSVSLKYGHNPGEYIPNILDIVGKALYTKRNQADLVRHNRHGNVSGDTHLNVIVFDNTGSETDPMQALVSGSYGDQNNKSLANILLAISGAFSLSSVNVPTIELRTYFNSSTGDQSDANLNKLASSVQSWIKNPTVSSDGNLLPNNSVSATNNSNISSNIQLVQVDLGNQIDSRSPSQGAWNKATEIVGSNSISSGGDQNVSNIDPIKKALFSKVVDIWVTFAPATTVQQISGSVSSNNDSQAAQNNLQQTLAAFNAKISSQTTK